MEETHFTQKDRDTLTKVEVKLDRAIDDLKTLSMNYVSITEYVHFKKFVEDTFATREHVDSLSSNVASLIDNQKWVTRTIMGLIIVGLIGLLFTIK